MKNDGKTSMFPWFSKRLKIHPYKSFANYVTLARPQSRENHNKKFKSSVILAYTYIYMYVCIYILVKVIVTDIFKSFRLNSEVHYLYWSDSRRALKLSHQWHYMWVFASIVFRCMYWCVWWYVLWNIIQHIGMYWHGMYFHMYWYVLFLVVITCIGKYWYVFNGHISKYSNVLVSIGMYEKMVCIHCIVHIGMYLYVLVSINLYWPVLDVLVSIGMYSTYWYVFLGIGK